MAAASATLEVWALPRLQQLLPLDEESLRQMVQYADTLPKDAAAEHLKDLLGDDGKALEFISAFNLRRPNAPAGATSQTSGSAASARPTNHDRQDGSSGVPKTSRGGRGKKKANIHSLPARQLEGQGNVGGAYVKRDEADYMPKSARRQNERQTHKDAVAENMALREERPDATKMPLITDDASATSKPITSKAPPSAAGALISDSLGPKKGSSSQSSRNASPAPKTKVNITGGTAMHGASSALSDLDSAIRSLEVQTNPSLASNDPAELEKRKCNCMATRHPLLDIAPNCVHCGKIICVKQGLGPCTFCGSPLLSPDDIAKVLRVLKDERGEERMRANNAAHRKPDVALGKARAYTGRDFLAQASSHSTRSSPLSSAGPTPAGSDDEAADKAKQHRDRLLGFQAQNARRTAIHDEAADYDVPASGTSMWASPAERAQQLKRQQRVLREMEWNARPEYEKRQMVASIDLKGGRVVRKMAAVERPDFGDENAEPEEDYVAPAVEGTAGAGRGAFGNNPLAKGLIKPVAREGKGKGKGKGGEAEGERRERSTWRRVQMDEDQDDNEAVILDGGVYGGVGVGGPRGDVVVDEPLGAEERGCG